MAEHRWTLLCRKAVLDQESDDVTLVDVVDRVRVTTDIAGSFDGQRIVGSSDLISVVVRSDQKIPEDLEAKVVVVYPDMSTLEGPNFRFDLTSSSGTRVIIRSQHIYVKSDGKHSMLILARPSEDVDWAEISRYSYEVQFESSEQSASTEVQP